MSDVTFGVKVSPETKERVSAMIEVSGLKSKEWFESLLSLYEMQRLKQGTLDFGKDLGELEIHTNRIVQLVGNMVTRATHEKEAVLQQIEGIKSSKDEIISGYQQELSEVKGQIQQYKQQTEDAIKDREELDKQVHQMEEAAENHRALIGEYKEKIDTLTGLVTQYKAANEENQELRSELSSLQQKAQEQAAQFSQLQKDNASLEEIYAVKFAQQKERHDDELERLIEKKDVEKERALLQLRTEYQERLQKANEEYTAKIQALYEEINSMRKKYEQQIESLKRKS